MSSAESSAASVSPSTQRARRTVWHWRDWPLTAKLLAMVLVPLLVILALAAVQLRTETARAGSYRDSDRVVQASDDLGVVLHDVQQERTAAVAYFAAGAGADASSLATHQQELGQAAGRLADRMAQLGDRPAGQGGQYGKVRDQLDRLPGLRQQVTRHALNAEQAVTAYTSITNALLGLDQALASSVGDDDLAAGIEAMHLVRTAQENVFYQQAVILGGISRGSLSTGEAAQVQLSDAKLTQALDQFRATATPGQVSAYQAQVAGPPVDQRTALKQRALTELTAPPGTSTTTPPLGAGQWNDVSLQTGDRMATVIGDLSDGLHGTAQDLKRRSDERTLIIAGIAVAAILITLFAVWLCSRHLRRSLRTLRRSARDIAEKQLPVAVAQVRAGEQIDTTPPTVPVRSRDELGQLARAFEQMHGQALLLAVDQANLRGNYSDVFINLSRRSESLVRRQLSLIEQMERSEEDPDALATLFQLDHLVTRMRRNNENLMVLSGSDLTRRFNRPIPLSDVVRAAVSEIEQYKRVSLQAPAQSAVVGYAASDMVRLVAELLDNATTFSAPDTTVTVATYDARDGGMSIDILDKGVGMSDEEVEAANAALADPGDVEVSTSRQMGLFVVGRLAGKHGVRVRMHGGEEIRGLRVTVTLPAALLTELPESAPPPPAPTSKPTGPIQHARPVTPPVPQAAVSQVTGSQAAGAQPAVPQAAGSHAAGSQAAGPERTTPQPAAVNGVRPAQPATAAAAAEPDNEKTPIFDTMLSVWFRDTKSSGATADSGRHSAGSTEWDSGADSGFAAAAAAPATQEFTAAGLPKRRPGARILPGSVSADTPARPATNGVSRPGSGPARHTAHPEHNADAVRGRLSSFQRGLQRGRSNVQAPAAEPTAEAPRPAAAVTAAGLPRRTPGASRVPTAPAPAATPARHSAEHVRGQLANFKAGITKGRENLAAEDSRTSPQSARQEKE